MFAKLEEDFSHVSAESHPHFFFFLFQVAPLSGSLNGDLLMSSGLTSPASISELPLPPKPLVRASLSVAPADYADRPEVLLRREMSSSTLTLKTEVPLHLLSTTNQQHKLLGVQQQIPTKLAAFSGKGKGAKSGKASHRTDSTGEQLDYLLISVMGGLKGFSDAPRVCCTKGFSKSSCLQCKSIVTVKWVNVSVALRFIPLLNLLQHPTCRIVKTQLKGMSPFPLASRGVSFPFSPGDSCSMSQIHRKLRSSLTSVSRQMSMSTWGSSSHHCLWVK